VPQERWGPHPEFLLPARPLVLWHFTDLSDPRYSFTRRYVRVRCDPGSPEPQKIGVRNRAGWAAYATATSLFLKRAAFAEEPSYPDFGSNTEVFTAGDFIELESLSPLRSLGPGETLEHVERWMLGDAPEGGASAGDAAVDCALGPLLAAPSPPGG
jgi:hypothetical protein